MRVAGNSQHVYQVVTGFALLGKRREVDVGFDVVPAAEAPVSSLNVLTATIDGRRVAYDMLDGYRNIPRPEMERLLSVVDAYFKRSFSERRNAELEHGDRIHPFGLSYVVTCGAPVFRAIRSRDPLRQKVSRTAKTLMGRTAYPGVRTFEAPPRLRDDPKVVFMTRVYDPSGEPGEDPQAFLDGNAGREREQINEMRAGCVRALREAFGPSFSGGLAPTAYGTARYPDCVTEAAALPRTQYVRAAKRADVGIATMGLHESNQWKLAEYVAASRAIVSERLRYEVPGFTPPENYLEFDTPEECVERTAELLGDPERRLAMMQANARHYEAYVRPDSAVRRTLDVVRAL